MWAKVITIKWTKDLNYFSLCALNVFNTRVSQFELNYWNKLTFSRHSNLLTCTCVSQSLPTVLLHTQKGLLFLNQKSTYFKGVVYVGALGRSICLPVSDTLISGLAVSTNELMSWIRCNWWRRHTIQNVQGWGYSRGPFHKTSLTNKPGLFQLVWLIVSWFGSK